jgi:orotate phosphoribosyltransferase
MGDPNPNPDPDRVADLLAERQGHFVFESGHHGRVWLDLERLFLHPERVQPLAEALAGRLRRHRPDVICAPLVEGAFVGLQVATVLGVPFTYSAPSHAELDKEVTDLFPVDYPIPDPLHEELRGMRVAIVNDVINAGSAVRGTLVSLAACDAEPIAIGTLAVYGSAGSHLAASHGVALEALASFESLIWEPRSCPLCEQGIAITRV